jgi:hypothetical protein
MPCARATTMNSELVVICEEDISARCSLIMSSSGWLRDNERGNLQRVPEERIFKVQLSTRCLSACSE